MKMTGFEHAGPHGSVKRLVMVVEGRSFCVQLVQASLALMNVVCIATLASAAQSYWSLA